MNKIKKISLFLVCGIILILSSCKKSINYITDIPEYKKLTKEVDKIEVQYDTNDGYTFDFTIDDQDELNEIMDLILNTKLEKSTIMDGGHTVLYIYKDSKVYRVSVSSVGYKDLVYAFETSGLYYKIEEIYTKKSSD